MTTVGPPTPDRGSAVVGEASYRYGLLLALILAVVVFVIAAPTAKWSRTVAVTVEGAAVVVAVTTARQRREIRYRNAAVVGVVTVGFVLAVATGIAHGRFISTYSALATAAIPVVIVRGVIRLLRDRGVTVQAVAGAVAIYLSVGLVFAWVIGFLSQFGSTPYFAQGTDGVQGDWVYFSFTTLTTTGFGDFSPATGAGHALAVLEMLTGQLYLVTVLGLMVGSLASGQGRREARAAAQAADAVRHPPGP